MTIRNIKIVTGSSAAGAALKMGFANPQSPTQPGVGHSDPNVVIENVIVTTSGGGAWDYGLHLTYAWNTKVWNSSFTNKNSTPYEGSAIYIGGFCVNSEFVDNTIAKWSNGFEIHCPQQNEGLIVDGGSISEVNTGIKQSTVYRLAYLSMQNAVIDCRQSGANCIEVTDIGLGLDTSLLRNNTFILAADAQNQSPPTEEYHCPCKMDNVIWVHNTFDSNNSAGGLVVMGDSSNTWNTVVNRNTFDYNPNGASLWLQNGSAYTSVVGNSFNGGWFYNQGTGTVSALNN